MPSRYLARDSSGRLIVPTDSVDGRRSEAWRALVVAVCVCPPSLRERVERAARKVSATGPAHAVHTAVGSRSSALKAQVGCWCVWQGMLLFRGQMVATAVFPVCASGAWAVCGGSAGVKLQCSRPGARTAGVTDWRVCNPTAGRCPGRQHSACKRCNDALTALSSSTLSSHSPAQCVCCSFWQQAACPHS